MDLLSARNNTLGSNRICDYRVGFISLSLFYGQVSTGVIAIFEMRPNGMRKELAKVSANNF